MTMGFSILSYVIQVLALLLSIGLDALFIWGFHVSLGWMGVALVSGPSSVCLIVFTLFIFNRFAVKPVWSSLLAKPSAEFWDALILTIPTIVMVLFTLICPLIVFGFVTKASKNIGKEKNFPNCICDNSKSIYDIAYMFKWCHFWSWTVRKLCFY